MLKKVKYVINGLKVLNIISWFVFSLGEGSAVLNTDFNLGYNCRLVGWTVMSGFLFCVVTLSGYIALNKYEQLLWERDHTDP
jgi:purine-cytosine permease-like protein